jgi:exodeoxyribonuclease VII large subunit
MAKTQNKFGRFVANSQTKQKKLPSNAAELSVSELSGAIKRMLEDGFGHVRLRGEISGYRGPHASGHCYFTLKDERARIDAVVWRGVFSRLKIKPEEGMEVIATGKVSSYPGSSKYQIIVEALEPAGIGAMMVQLEERKKRLQAEGLFDEARKKPIPFLPTVVGVVTSPTGAVIRDILAGFTERFPTHVIVWPVKVQGEGSAEDVARAIRGFNALPVQAGPNGLRRPNTLIVARGGGSLEDLWSFNDEAVARAAAASTIPLIAAVGHETDWTLIDLVADARAPTPTKAAEWTVPKFSDLVGQTGDLKTRLNVAIRRFTEASRRDLKAAIRGIPRLEDLIALPRQRFDSVEKRLGRALLANTRTHHVRLVRAASRLQPAGLYQRCARGREQTKALAGRLRPAFINRIRTHRATLDSQQKLLTTLSYRSVLGRGFAIVRDADGQMIRQAATIDVGQRLDIELADGHVAAIAGDSPSPEPTRASRTPSAPPTGKAKPRAKKAKTGGGSNQGSLF